MAHAGVTELAERPLHELSGGQRQRAWLAMVLAQETSIVLLDEPTTFLDINHQHDLMELLAGLRLQGRTLVAVLHDLNQAARYADVMVALGPDGRIYDQGPPQRVMTVAMMQAIFGLACHVDIDPVSARPRVIPLAGGSKGC
jgi:iron complex transport system ATP-binding protein